MAALVPEGDGNWRSLAPQSAGTLFRLCSNYSGPQICNWAVPVEDSNPLCRSCQLTRTLPDLSLPGNHDAWRKLEAAKRRVLYSLFRMGLTVAPRQQDAGQGLAFEFLGDAAIEADPGSRAAVMTGHDSGVITVNAAEANDAEREKRRLQLHEPYRTLLGHLRHETGHYFWDVIVKDSVRLEAFRAAFGDEQADYAAALQRHYEQGAPADWNVQFISAYASMHPWEDWAETWAHYLHMTDALETAASSGLTIAAPGLTRSYAPAEFASSQIFNVPFEKLIEHWMELAFVLNNLNRSLGLADGYPFVLSAPVIEKLRFTHESIASTRTPLSKTL